MKSTLVLSFLVFLGVSCGQKDHNKESLRTEDASVSNSSATFDPRAFFALDSLVGYSLRANDRTIRILRSGKEVLSAFVRPVEPWVLRRASKFDSLDVAKGIAMAFALDPPLSDADDCNSKYGVDSLCEYKNKFGLRCFHIWAKSKTTCEDGYADSSHYQGYFVDISKGHEYCIIQIPSGLLLSHHRQTSEAIDLLISCIKQPR
jgi:hypothetical protein